MDSEPSGLLYNIDFEFLTVSILILLLLVCSAFISGSEVSLFSLSQKNLDDIAEENFNKYNLINKLLEKPKKLLATILIANNFVNIAIVILFSYISEKIFSNIHQPLLRFILEVIIVTFFILLFGEVLPKIYANRNNIIFSQIIAVPISILNKLLSPISVPMRNITYFIENKFSIQKTNLSVNQLSQALELTNQEDTTEDEQKILEGIVTFGNTEVKQVMSQRLEIFALENTTTYQEVLTKIVEKGYSRIPVYKENIDQIEGVLFIKDLIPHINKKEFQWQKLIREPFFVPENKKLDDLLKEFQGMKNHLAIVVDEYGGTSGLISLEDVLEEIVGDISDEFDDEDMPYTKINDKNYLFEAKISLRDFYKVISVDENLFENQKGNAETLAGFILEISKNFPKKNQKIKFDNLTFTVLNIDVRRIKEIKVTID
mgnify:CR=1 FL=1